MTDAAPPLPRLLRADATRTARGLAAGFVALVTLTTCLIVLGALVRAHGAGLACPDWPLCFGALVPQMNLEVGFEWTHRLVAGSVALLFAGLGILALREGAIRREAAPLLALTASLLGLQVVLGALTVWHLLAAWTVTAHLVVGNAFNAGLLLLALRLRALGRSEDAGAGAIPAAVPPAARAALAAVGLLLLLQVVLGGLVSSSFAGMACPEWPRCNGGAWFPAFGGLVGLHLAHRWNAALLLAALGGAALAVRGLPQLRPLGALALGLGLAQTAVGVANVRLAIPVEVTALHSALSALLVLTQSAALYAAFRKESGIAR
jgi:cytochrome c oxidase assembly protein subunit 15